MTEIITEKEVDMIDFSETEMRHYCRNPRCRMRLPAPGEQQPFGVLHAGVFPAVLPVPVFGVRGSDGEANRTSTSLWQAQVPQRF